jgi:hypothetical protein
VTDGGLGLPDPTAGTSRPDPSAPGGRGLWISRQLGDVFALDSGAKGTTVHVAIEYDIDSVKPR